MVTIIADIHGGCWRVTEARPTTLGFDLLIGRPHPASRQGATVILTDDLAQVLDAWRDRPAELRELLPIGATALKRLRAVVGHHWRRDRMDWYLARLDDLAALTGPAFAARHGVSEAAASQWRALLLGPRQRAAGWWRDEAVCEALTSGPAAQAAAALGIAEGAVRRIRWILRQEGLTDAPD